MTNKGKLFLIPNIIAEGTQQDIISSHVRNVLTSVNYFLAEDIRTARRFLSSLKIYDSIEALNFSVLDKNTAEQELATLLSPLHQGHNMGVVSESGCPGIADPGAIAVKYAHAHSIQVVPLVGPSSILLALMASGLNGQRFAFHGYLPIDSKDLSSAIKALEKESRTKHQTQIFIETPYRNNQMLANLLKHLNPETYLCLAQDITGATEFIFTKKVKDWRAKHVDLPKQPAVFLFLS